MDNTFNRDSTNIVKGMAILLIVVHHVFWNSFFAQDSIPQVFIFPVVTRLITRWGFCFIHVFSAITGYGFAISIRKKHPFSVFLRREVSLLSVFLPIYLLSTLVFIVFCGGFNQFYKVYYQDTILGTVINILLDSLGLSDMFGMSILNPTWWYFSAAHFICFSLFVLSLLCSIRLKRSGYLIIWLTLLVYLFFFPCLYGCMMLSALSGFVICYYNIFGIISKLYCKFIKNYIVGYLIETVLLFIGFILWFQLIHIFDPHFVSAIMLPLPIMLLAKDFINKLVGINKFFIFLGKKSAYIFMIHTLVYSVYPFAKEFVFSAKYAFVTYLLVVAISVFGGIIIDRIEEIIGYKKYIKSIKEKCDAILL